MENFYKPNIPAPGALSPHLQHSGKWTVEEKEYADALAAEFQSGALEIEEGISLRRFLSQALRCSAKRISKKYEGSDYNGKMLYQKSDKEIAPEEAQERRERLQDLEKKYQESLKVLKMVEDSKQQNQRPSTQRDMGALGRLPPSFLQSPSPSAAALAMGSLLSPADLLPPGAASVAQLEAELTLQRAAARRQMAVAATSGDPLLQAYISNSLSRASRLPLAVSGLSSGLGTRRRSGEVSVGLGDDSSSHSQLVRRSGSPALGAETSLLGKIGTGRGLPSIHAAMAQGRSEGRTGSLAASSMIRQGWRPGQTMLLPNSIASLHTAGGKNEEEEAERGDAGSKKAQQNALILAALMNRKSTPKAPSEDSPSTARKRQVECDEMTLPPSAKFARLL